MPASIQCPLQTDAIDKVIADAMASGALQAINTRHEFICVAGMRFMVRWIESLAHKDAARVVAAGRHDPNFNPFLPPEPDLLVGALGNTHLVVLNKYPVIARHLLIITRAFAEQNAPLTAADFDALAQVMDTLGGLGFYNGGTEAGASQRHKHLQWIPERTDSASLKPFSASLPAGVPIMGCAQHPHMPWRHVFVRHATADPTSPATTITGPQLHAAFEHACVHLGVDADAHAMSPYNLLADKEWMLLVPRSREHYQGISVNALGFAGSLFVRKPEQIAIIRAISPLQLLAEVACR